MASNRCFYFRNRGSAMTFENRPGCTSPVALARERERITEKAVRFFEPGCWISHSGPCVQRNHTEHLLPCHRRDAAEGGDKDRPVHCQGGGKTADGETQGKDHGHLSGKETMDPQGRLNNAERPAGREESPRRVGFHCLWTNMWSGSIRAEIRRDICADNATV